MTENIFQIIKIKGELSVSFQELEQMSQKLFNTIRQMNDINEELINQIEELLPQYTQYYKDYPNSSPGQFISDNQIGLFMAYTKAFTVPIVIANRNKIFANASGLLLKLDRTFLITNLHVYEEWKKLNDQLENFFQIGSLSIPVEDLIIDKNSSLDLISISLPEQVIKLIEIDSYKKFYSPKNWPFETEKETIVVASGYPGKVRKDYIGFTHLKHGSVAEKITDLTESKYIVPFNRHVWEEVIGVYPNELTDLGGFSGGPVFSFENDVVNLIGIIFEDGGNFFDGIRVIRSSVINTDGTISNQWGY
ncbi:hypothetical protein G6549_26855 [Bacillus sp. MM2020_1]|nr:hypothetical protein [Bacillus sp. MM2020_1]